MPSVLQRPDKRKTGVLGKNSDDDSVDGEYGVRLCVSESEPMCAKLKALCGRCKLSRNQQCTLMFISVLFIGASIPLMVHASWLLDEMARSAQCLCSIRDFQASQTNVEKGKEAPTCETMRGLVVTAKCPDYKGGRMVFIQNWMPEYVWGYHDDGKVPKHDEFGCCPRTVNDDMCAFWDADAELFCDSYGFVDENCPIAPWDCYIFDLEAKMQTGEDLTAEDLVIGSLRSSWIFLSVGISLMSVGVAIPVIVMRKQVMLVIGIVCKPIRSRICGKKKRRTSRRGGIFERIVCLIPDFLRTARMDEIVEIRSACRIQKHWRGLLARTRFKKLVLTLMKNGDARLASRMNSGDQACWKDEKKCRKIVRQYEKERGRYREMNTPSLDDETPFPNQVRGVLYDTGEEDTFRRFVCSRLVSEPSDERQRLEIAITPSTEDVKDVLRVQRIEHGHGKLIVGYQPPAHLAEAFGLRRGQNVVKVGKLEWPRATGEEMLEKIQTAPRPLILVLEGEAENPDKPQCSVKVRRAPQVRSPTLSPVSSRCMPSPSLRWSPGWTPAIVLSPTSTAQEGFPHVAGSADGKSLQAADPRLPLPGAVPQSPRSPANELFDGRSTSPPSTKRSKDRSFSPSSKRRNRRRYGD